MSCRLKWSTEIGDGVDGLVVADDRVFTVSPEAVRAFDREMGQPRWCRSTVFDSGNGRVRAGVVGARLVLALEYAGTHAFDIGDGMPRAVGEVRGDELSPVGARAPWTPPGITFADGELRRARRVIWRGLSSTCPQLGLLGEVLVVNDFKTGMSVIDSEDGRVVLDVPLGRRNFDESRVEVADSEAFTVTSDGVLHAVMVEDGSRHPV